MDNDLSKELETLLKNTPDNMHDTKEYISCVYSLMCAYESEGNVEGAKEIARKIINKSVDSTLITDEQLRTAYDVLARSGDFEAYCIALEWNRPIEKKFYLPRARILKKEGVMGAFQDLQDDKLDLLVLNMPPRLELEKVH